MISSIYILKTDNAIQLLPLHIFISWLSHILYFYHISHTLYIKYTFYFLSHIFKIFSQYTIFQIHIYRAICFIVFLILESFSYLLLIKIIYPLTY